MAMEATELTERFKAEAAGSGAIVHEAATVVEVNDCLLNLAREHGVRLVVKASSPLADRIGLRHRLEGAGIDVTETGIGEWLAQLAETRATSGAPPSSMEEAASLLSGAIGEELGAEHATLLRAARGALRQAYVEADMGVTEASLAVAETGTLIMVGDEGNDRLAAILPRIHVTLLDSRNIVPAMEDATARLRLLIETVWQGKTPSYVTYLTGRNTTADIPGALMARAQGPDEEHVVFVHGDATA